jgi:hypothetical protein
MSPTTNSEIAQPTASRQAPTATSPHPASVTSKENRAQQHSATMPIPRASLQRPNRATPARYSTSLRGVVMRLSRLRDQVSSMNPTDTAIWDW